MLTDKPIYLDYAATTPLDPQVLEAMLPYLTHEFGNAASRNHPYGWAAEKALDIAREQVASYIGASPQEIIWTSGGTEANNLALKGIAEIWQDKGNHIITQATEHRSVLDTCKALERKGFKVTYLRVDPQGWVDPEQVRQALTPKTILISVMLANNEIGTMQPIADIGSIAKARGVFFHVDACWGVNYVPFNVQEMGIDLASFTAHKLYGPKGIGALYVRSRSPRVRLAPQMHGGGHERGMRHGTVNVPGVVGMGKAFEIAARVKGEEVARLWKLDRKLIDGITKSLDLVHLNGHPQRRVPGTVNIRFRYVEGESFLMSCRDLAIASGAACTSATLEPSHVLRAVGQATGDDALAHTSIRFTLGRWTTEEDVDRAIELTVTAVRRLRALSPLYERAIGSADPQRGK
ncbi:MAG: IscS subfamily cysteine desulfurase [Abditibacteriales bacterium]|nr:IscS subfamily cysteine desulfurase [Abditibacteriales bacterium]MDW8364520.1 IscS subfamily cysteine desulfurase [Abditibacteriales bacterium]